MRADFEQTAVIQHAGGKGTAREQALVEFLRKYLPSTVEVVGSSEVVTAEGETSGQCDVVIYDPSAPLLLDDAGHRILPAECVYAVIEVKSRLDWRGLQDAADKIAKLKRLSKTAYLPPVAISYQKSIYGQSLPYTPSLGYVFAYDSVGRNGLWQNLAQLMQEQPVQERIDALWVLGDGMFNWISPEQDLKPHADVGLWLANGDVPPGQDVLLNMMVMLNTHLTTSFMPKFNMVAYVKNVSVITNVTARNIDKRTPHA